MTKDELCRHIQQTTFLEACQIKCVRDFLCFCSVTFQWFPCKSSWYLSLSGSSIMPCKSITSILSSKTSQLSATMGSSHCPLYICSTYLQSHLSVQFKEIYSVVILFYSASFCLYYFIAVCLSVPPYQFFSSAFCRVLYTRFISFFLCPKRNVSVCISRHICLLVSVVRAVSLVHICLAYSLILSPKYDSSSVSARFSALRQ